MNTIKVLIADDHALVRMGLVSLLQMEPDINVVGEAEDGEDAILQVQKTKPDVIVLDLMMPVKDGIEATRTIKEMHPKSNVLILTTSSSSDAILQAIDAGAAGVILKSAANAELLQAIRTVAAGGRAISPDVRRMIDEDPPVPKLTRRQQEILESVTRGLTNPDIAKQFGISLGCVKDHINLIFTKLGAANRSEAVAIAIQKHLLKI